MEERYGEGSGRQNNTSWSDLAQLKMLSCHCGIPLLDYLQVRGNIFFKYLTVLSLQGECKYLYA